MVLESHKLRRRDFVDLEGLLTRLGLVTENKACPSNIFVHPKDYARMLKAHKKAFRTEHSYLRIKKVDTSVGMYFLNLGPNTCESIKEGYCAVLRMSL